ncbi:MAG: pyruvate kinase [Deltaproteobacteria bacterium]
MTAKTKIICTLGPASDSVTVLRKMMQAGMDVARLNLSHGTHREHAERIASVRRLNKTYRRRLRILLDLEGPRVRVGALRQPVPLQKGQSVLLSNQPRKRGEAAIPFDYEGSLADIEKNTEVFIDDGQIALRVERARRHALTARVVTPGTIRSHKGVNIPGVRLAFRGLSDKDRLDIAFGVRHGVDFVAQSFVRDARDMLHVGDALGAFRKKCRLIAKIENEEGIRNIDAILDVSDGVMIARGDLGVSLPIYEVPVWQKLLLKECRKRRKFSITATQMLESMTEHLRPTRAEVSDVANAILDGSDYVMLSGETAMGRYPAQTVQMMDKIIKFTEGAFSIR